ncbi:MAG TPA: helix-turn-helix domain-containing protein [Acidimicrobiales bacterium]|nr:helix-turn-helix domain-containing protein [Acidimicrobiales bacterium]
MTSGAEALGGIPDTGADAEDGVKQGNVGHAAPSSHVKGCTPSSLAGRCTVRNVKASRSPGQRAGLTHAMVLDAARELVADEGLDGLTMRALARRLQVAPNALYSHVPTKTSLIDDILDDVLSAVAIPDPDLADWQAGLRTMMTSTHRVLLEHAGLVPLYLARRGARGPNAQRLGEVMLSLLGRGGVAGASARDAQRALIVHAIGSAAITSRRPLQGDQGDTRGTSRTDLIRTFERSLSWLLTGIAATGERATT